MTAPLLPTSASLAGDTDLFIKAVAEAADARLGQAARMSILAPAGYNINGNGDVIMGFSGLPRGITGAAVYFTVAPALHGQTTKIPNPPYVDYLLPLRVGWPVIVGLNPAAAGIIYVRIMVTGYQVPSAGPWVAAQPAGANQTVYLAGLAWGPA